MGDCRIIIQLTTNVLDLIDSLSSSETDNTTLSNGLITLTSKVWSADTTIEDIFLSTSTEIGSVRVNTQHRQPKPTLRSLIDTKKVSVWDCTSYPSNNISELCQNVGKCRVNTLYGAGWYPSGRLQVLPIDATSTNGISGESYDDVQYNYRSSPLTTTFVSSKNKVQIQLNSRETDTPLLPSEILHTVAHRFGDENDTISVQDALRARQEYNQKKQKDMERRHRTLDANIEKLRCSTRTKHSNVSDQVRNMLIKSRAVGRSNIIPEDRIYLHCLIWNDDGNDNTEEEYKFFSLQDTIGHALDTVIPTNISKQLENKEMLIQYSHNHLSTDNLIHEFHNEYRRLPSIMRFYEAIQLKAIHHGGTVNTVVIRCYNSNDQEATPTINTHSIQSEIGHPIFPSEISIKDDTMANVSDVSNIQLDTTSIPLIVSVGNAYNQLWNAIHGVIPIIATDQNSNPKKLAAKEKVRQMQMKSKAKGDDKRIKQLDLRFYLQLIVARNVVNHDNNACDEDTSTSIQIIENTPIFVSRSDCIQRLALDYFSKDSKQFLATETNKHVTIEKWELLVLAPSKKVDIHPFRSILSSDQVNSDDATLLTWENMECHKMVNSFDYLILHIV